MRASGFVAALGFVVCSLGLAPSALAFCRTTTVSVPANDMPPQGGCSEKGGFPLFWRNACVGYSLQRDASRQVSLPDATRLAAAAFTRWTGALCDTTVNASARVSIDVRQLDAVACSEVRYNTLASGGGNANVIVFRDDAWPHNDSANTLAITTVTFNPDTGEVYDADMEINTAQHTVTVNGDVPKNGYDLQSILTHETGHFLGLAHSGDTHATMYARYDHGSTAMRELTSDDVKGICSIYPPGNLRAVDAVVSQNGTIAAAPCDATPRGGFSSECATAPKKSGCAAAPPSSAMGGWSAISLGLVAMGALGARRRARRRGPSA